MTRLTIEYDGTAFAGWARQPGRRTIQGELERALRILMRRDVDLAVAGRTDTGVHALAQVASYAGEPVSARSLNALLPDDVAVLACETAPAGFDARRDALARRYRYRLCVRCAPPVLERARSLWWPRPLDLDALAGCAARLLGTHDFRAFTPTQTDHVRFERVVYDAGWRQRGEMLELEIEADAFLRHMVRVLVGTMLGVAAGRWSLGSFGRLLDGAPRTAAGPTVPAQGLHLVGVRYPDR